MKVLEATPKRDLRFVAVHRGGNLTASDHRALMRWAVASTRQLLGHCPHECEAELEEAIKIAERWADGNATTGEAMAASRSLHRKARSMRSPITVYCHRIAAHSLATAHMGDHALGPLYYGQKLFLLLNRPFDEELAWMHVQLKVICPQMEEAVISVLSKRFSIQLCAGTAETSE